MTGLGQDVGKQSYYTSKNNRYRRNTYYLGPDAKYFNWMNGKRIENEWSLTGRTSTAWGHGYSDWNTCVLERSQKDGIPPRFIL